MAQHLFRACTDVRGRQLERLQPLYLLTFGTQYRGSLNALDPATAGA